MNDSAVTIRFDEDRYEFEPGETLRATCEIPGHRPDDVSSVEWLVFWRTEGKGDEDSGDHSDERESSGRSLAERRADRLPFECRLPHSPLSYDGVIVKIRWFVHVQVTFGDGEKFETDAEFRLGSVAPVHEVTR